jgi:hypothetical protein
MVKSREMRWMGYEARMGRGEMCTGFWWGNLGERSHLEAPDMDGKITLRSMFKEIQEDVG